MTGVEEWTQVQALKAHDTHRRGDVYLRVRDTPTLSLIVAGYLRELTPPTNVLPAAATLVEPASLANPRRSRVKHPVRPDAPADQ